ADFDGDGFPDLVAANYNFEFYWYKNNGSGGFGPDHFITTSFGNLNLLAADPDQDNDLDIMLMGQSAGWLTNDGLGNFTDSVVVDAGFTYAMRTECVDMDNDGSLDLVVWPVANVGWSNAPQAMRFYRNLGNNQFAPAHAFGPAFPYSGVCIADLDNDGLNDIAFTSYGSLDWYKNATNTATIQGHCFVDDNGNGLWDANEAPLANIGILVEPEGEVSFSDSTGLFGFRFSSGSYTLSALPASCWNVTVAPAPPVVVLDTVVHGLLFGFQNFGNQLKISPYLSSEFPRCDTVVAFYLYASNPSCLPASGQLSLALDSLVNFVGAEPLPDVSTGNTLIWNLDTIAPWEGSAITLHLMNADASHVGDTIHLQAFTWVNDATGSLVLSDSVFYQAEIQCAYDPNDKQVDRATVPPDYWVSDRELIYTIRFQNTGNDTAFSVRLADTLNAALNWPTFRALNASHPYNLSLNLNSGLLQFEFNPIQLPDSTTNPQASQGFVQFAIELQPWLPAGTVVPNRAGIFFDANPVVLTNTAQTEVLDFVASHEPPAAAGLTITPNPLTGPCTLHFDAPAPDGATVQLFDVGGRLLQNLNVQAGEMNQELNLGNLPSGWYRVQWNRPGQRPVSGRLVKI
ncbi:MAG TPA: FG-GAP-like repeat-containing protein, partial [Saprospiraceae bacterium]|nr:FG-GAP-like repeat-containing protein [Saprospiraceae bacterium]